MLDSSELKELSDQAIELFTSLSSDFPHTLPEFTLVLAHHQSLTHKLDALGCHLRSQRNSLLPVYRLPPEVLIRIFQFCLPGPEAAWPNPLRNRSPRLYSFSRVCDLWRRTALSTSCLWSTPPLHLHVYAEEILVRARDTLLTMIAAPSTHDGRRQIRNLADTTRQALLKGPRIQRLALSASPGWVDHVLEAFCGPALELKRLDVCARVWNDYDVVDDEDLEHIDVHILAADLLGNAVPKLRRLRLGNCEPPVTSGLYSRLTHLYISFDRLFCHVRGIQATELFLIFNKAHSLISVDMRGIDRDTLEDLVQPDRVTLTDLLFLRLCGEGILENTSRVMDFLEVAPTTQLCIKESDCGDLRELATLLGQQPNVDRVPPIDRLRIRGDPMNGNGIAVKAESGDLVPLRLAVVTFEDDVMDTFGQTLTAVVEGLPLQHLRCLEVYSGWTENGDEAEEWQAVLAGCPMLEHIIVRAHAVLGFSAAISADADSSTLHPHLKDITLTAARLGEQLDGLSVLAHVQFFAHARQTAGCELRFLHLDNCYYSPGTAGVVGLKSFVGNLRMQLCRQRDVALSEAAPDGYDGDSNYEDEPRHLSDVDEDN